jgi:hypothetical protein
MNNQLDKDHVHSWIKWKKTEKTTYFKCAHPQCFSTIDGSLLVGKVSLCPSCNQNTFILDKHDLKRTRPVCPQLCSMTKEDIAARNISTGVSGALNKLFNIPDGIREEMREGE